MSLGDGGYAIPFPADVQMEYIGKPGTEEEKLVRRGIDILRMSRNVRNMIEFEWAKDNDAYDAKFDKKEMAHSEFLGVPRLFIPKTYAQTQRMMEECLEQWFFDVEEFADIQSWKNVPRATLQIVKALLNYRLNDHPIQSYQEVYEFCQDGIKNKVGVLKIYPRFKISKGKKKWTVDEYAEDVPPPTAKDQEELIQYFTPVLECVPYEDVFVHFEATWKNYWNMPMVHRVKRTRDYCRKRGYKNIDVIPWAGTFPGTDLIKMQRSLNQGSPFAGAPEDILSLQEIWLYECWDLQPGDFNYLESGSFVLGGSADRPMALMRGWVKNELPFQFDPTEPVRPPFVIGTAFPEAHTMYGKSLPGVTRDLQKETNARFNSEREASARALRPPTLVNKNANVDLMALMIRKIGGIVQAADISENSVREMQVANPIPISLPGQQRTDQLYTEITSIGPQELGGVQPGTADQSATQSSTQSTNANKKMNMVIRNLTTTGIIPMLRYLMRLEQEYEQDAFIEMVTGRMLGWKFVKDKDRKYVGPRPSVVIQGDFDFRVTVGINKNNQLQQLKMITELGAQANGMMVQALQVGAAKAQDVKFFNAGWAFQQMAKLLGQKNTEEMMFPAIQPPPPQAQQPQQSAMPPGQPPGAQRPSPPGVGGFVTPAQANFSGVR
jgi:hypothetical protein